jgi:hypothetical protein
MVDVAIMAKNLPQPIFMACCLASCWSFIVLSPLWQRVLRLRQSLCLWRAPSLTPRPARLDDAGPAQRAGLPCDALSQVAPRNSLRGLRPLRSNSLGELDAQSALRAPTWLLRFSATSKAPGRPGDEAGG